MSALGDALETKDREFVLRSTLTIAVDSATIDAVPTYSVRLDAPEMSETLLSALTPEDLAAALTEFTVWVTDKW